MMGFGGKVFLTALTFVALPVVAQTKVKVTMDIAGCEAALLERAIPRPLDYAASELEGSYLDLIEEAQKLAAVPASRRDFASEEFLAKKASFLNDLSQLTIPLIVDNARTGRSNIQIGQLATMMLSLGVAPQMYGLHVEEDSRRVTLHPDLQAKLDKSLPPSARKRGFTQAKQASIGFVAPTSEGEPALPDFLKRSIGFAPVRIERSAANPLRRGGKLEISIEVIENVAYVRVIDNEKGGQVAALLERLQLSEHKGEAKNMELKFEPEEGWFVAFESIVNPDGKIGF